MSPFPASGAPGTPRQPHPHPSREGEPCIEYEIDSERVILVLSIYAKFAQTNNSFELLLGWGDRRRKHSEEWAHALLDAASMKATHE